MTYTLRARNGREKRTGRRQVTSTSSRNTLAWKTHLFARPRRRFRGPASPAAPRSRAPATGSCSPGSRVPVFPGGAQQARQGLVGWLVHTSLPLELSQAHSHATFRESQPDSSSAAVHAHQCIKFPMEATQDLHSLRKRTITTRRDSVASPPRAALCARARLRAARARQTKNMAGRPRHAPSSRHSDARR